MVVSLFETGYLATGAGLFEAFPGQLSRYGMAIRVGPWEPGGISEFQYDAASAAARTAGLDYDAFGASP